MKCPACNATNPDHATYCKSCGKAMQSNLKKCPNGHDYDASVPSCPHCPGQGMTFGALPTARMSGDMEKTKLDTVGPKLVPGGQGTTKPAFGKDDKTVILGKPAVPPTPTEIREGIEPKPHAQSNRMLVGWLVTFDLDPNGQDFQLKQGRCVIGNGKSTRCDIKLDVPGVSDEHAILLCRNGKFIIEDNLSSNGTFVNGEMIEDKVYLNENDIVRIATIDLKLKTV